MTLLISWTACSPDDPRRRPPPLGDEEPCDRVDQNGDGVAADPIACAYGPEDADLVFRGTLWVVPDVDGNGGADLWGLESDGPVTVFDGVTQRRVFRVASGPGSGGVHEFWSPTVGDFDGDGLADAGVLDAIYSAPRGSLGPEDAALRLLPPTTYDWTYPSGDDVDGDGVQDLVVNHLGSLVWAAGPFSGDVALGQANLRTVPPATGDLPPPPPAHPPGCEHDLTPLGDYTGDGVDDWTCVRRGGGTLIFDEDSDDARSVAIWPDLHLFGAADCDGDGTVDLIGAQGYGDVGIFAGGARGEVHPDEVEALVTLWDLPVVQLAELDGEPGLDLLLTNASTWWVVTGLCF